MSYPFPFLCRICDFFFFVVAASFPSKQSLQSLLITFQNSSQKAPRTSPTCPLDVCVIVLTFCVVFSKHNASAMNKSHRKRLRDKPILLCSIVFRSSLKAETSTQKKDVSSGLWGSFTRQISLQWSERGQVPWPQLCQAILLSYLQLLACLAWRNSER